MRKNINAINLNPKIKKAVLKENERSDCQVVFAARTIFQMEMQPEETRPVGSRG